jgi:alpha-glucosidase
MSRYFILLGVLLFFYSGGAQNYELNSPDNRLRLNLSVDEQVRFSVTLDEKEVIVPSVISMNLGPQGIWGQQMKVLHHQSAEINDTMVVPVSHKDRIIPDHYRYLHLEEDTYDLEFRVYNDGIAYRYIGKLGEGVTYNVYDEKIDLRFPEKSRALFPEEESLYSHYERKYLDISLDSIGDDRFCSLPVLVQNQNNTSVLISESMVSSYPHLFLSGTESNGLSSLFPKYVLETRDPDRGADRSQVISKSADFHAQSQGERTFPWRTFIISDKDHTFVESNLNRLLGGPLQKDYSWVKPGKVAWDWYNANNLNGVDFKSGIDTKTYKYYLDFASDYGIEYVILDEGWTKSTTEIMESKSEIDIPELVRYGGEKGVQLILWVLWKPLEENTEEILALYKSWGAAGIKVDFMQRADQAMVESYEKIARIAAKHELLVDYHGAFKPAGLRNQYPNVLSYEGVKGNENNKWSADISPEHNVTIPFIRMAAGPMDFTPGAMANAQEANHAISFNRPMSLGTRCHQVAMYILYESPLQMLCDSPTSYRKDHHTADFISRIPTTWDETTVLEAAVGDYLVLWRRKGSNYYLGGLTDWKERAFTINLDFLPEGYYRMEIMQDGINADKMAEDYQTIITEVRSGEQLKFKLAPGGGYAAIITKK